MFKRRIYKTLTLFFYLFISFCTSAQNQEKYSSYIPIFDGDSLKIHTFDKDAAIDEDLIIRSIEEYLRSLEYGILSVDTPIRTSENEIYKEKDTVGWWVFKKVISHPVVVRHRISIHQLVKNNKTRKSLFLESFVEMPLDLKVKDSTRIIKRAKKYSKQELQNDIEQQIKILMQKD